MINPWHKVNKLLNYWNNEDSLLKENVSFRTFSGFLLKHIKKTIILNRA